MRKRDERLDLLIAKGLDLKRSIERCKAYEEKLEKEMALVHKELEPYFQGDGAVEHIATEFGTAMRVLDEKLTLDPDAYCDVAATLGSQFGAYFETKLECTARPHAREDLVSSHSVLSGLIGEFIRIERNRHFVFIPGKVARVLDVP